MGNIRSEGFPNKVKDGQSSLINNSKYERDDGCQGYVPSQNLLAHIHGPKVAFQRSYRRQLPLRSIIIKAVVISRNL